MIRYFFKRILLLIPVVLLVSLIVFTLMDIAPGDPLSAYDLTDFTEEDVAALRSSLGLDDPLLVRYGRYMFGLVRGDLGVSDHSKLSVFGTFISRLPNTLLLVFVSFTIGVSIAIPMGIRAARRAGMVSDNLTTAITMIGMSMPGFWLAILMILLFAYRLQWLPAGSFRDGWQSVVLPGVCAAMTLVATTTRQTRSSMLEVLKADYLRTARAKGVPESAVIRKHALGNALIPIVTSVGIALSLAVAGTAVIETVFAWPGVGRIVVESMIQRDVTSTTGTVILTTILYVLVQLMVDMLYAFIDPRIKAQYVSADKRKKRAEKLGLTNVKSAPQLATQLSEAAAQSWPVNNPIPALEPKPASDMAVAGGAAASAAKAVTIEAVSTATASTATATTVTSSTGDDKSGDVADTSFGTALDMGADTDDAPETIVAGGELYTRRYKKRSMTGEAIHHLLRNPGAIAGLIILSLMLSCAIASLFIPFEMVTAANIPNRFSPPVAAFPFGTDGMGRNLFIRVVYAARFSLPIGFGATTIGAFVGVMLGSTASYYGGIVDDIIMRFSDSLHSIPGLLLGMVIITVLGRSLPNLIIAIGISSIPAFIRMSRASTLAVKGNEFVEAARAIGLSNFRIIFTQVLPNGMAPIIITFTTHMGFAVLASAGLSFLGFGIPVPNPEWGALVSAGRDNIRDAPWLTTFPGMFIMLTVMAFNLLGDGLRDALDPKLKKR